MKNLNNLYNRNINGIDLFKFVGSIFIFTIHICPFNDNDVWGWGGEINYYLQNGICRVAVPFYFVVSGYLLYKNNEDGNVSRQRIKKYIFRLLRSLGLWSILLFIGPSWHLWYIGALVVSILIVWVLLDYHVKFWGLLVFSSILYFISLLSDTYYGMITRIIDNSFLLQIIKSAHKGPFVGLLFVIIGIYIADKKNIIKKCVCVFGTIISFMCLVFEVYFVRAFSLANDYNSYLSLVPLIVFLFNLSLQLHLTATRFYIFLRKMGVLIFFSHLFVNTLVKEIIKMFFDTQLNMCIYSLSLISTLMLAFIIYVLSHKKATYLRYLYE